MAWLLEGERARSGEVARPATVLQPRDEPLRWDVSPEASDLEISLIRLHDGGEELLDPESDESLEPSFVGRLEAAGEGSATSPPVEPGIYRFELRASSATPSDSIAAGGIVEVERWAASLRIPPLDVANPILAGPEGEGVAGAQAGRPLRTHPLPYVVMLILLGAEWLGRRRVGLS
jgi:hypothetical protein